MGKIIKFPTGGRDALDQETSNANRRIVLETRLMELEKRSEHYREDIEYIGECLMADTEEMSAIISELAWINGFDSIKPMSPLGDPELAKTLTDWLERDKEGTDHEDS